MQGARPRATTSTRSSRSTPCAPATSCWRSTACAARTTPAPTSAPGSTRTACGRATRRRLRVERGMRSCLYVGRLRHERTVPERERVHLPGVLVPARSRRDRRPRRATASSRTTGAASSSCATPTTWAEPTVCAPGSSGSARRRASTSAARASSCSPSCASSGTCSTRCRSTGAGTRTARSLCVVAEVHNTFGERHAYLLRARRPARSADGRVRMGADKAFHVSPFMGLEGTLRVRARCRPGRLVCVRIDEERARHPVLPGGAGGEPRRARPGARSHACSPATR